MAQSMGNTVMRCPCVIHLVWILCMFSESTCPSWAMAKSTLRDDFPPIGEEVNVTGREDISSPTYMEHDITNHSQIQMLMNEQRSHQSDPDTYQKERISVSRMPHKHPKQTNHKSHPKDIPMQRIKELSNLTQGGLANILIDPTQEYVNSTNREWSIKKPDSVHLPSEDFPGEPAMLNKSLAEWAAAMENASRARKQETAELVTNVTRLLDGLLQGYDRKLRPGFGGPPLVVDVNLNIRSMGPISEKDMAYQLDCYFRQSWVDRRLAFTGSMQTLGVSVNILERLWKPDTHFFNGKRSYLHTVTSPNKLLRINQDGRILYSMRLTIKATCPMHLENFPMDTQTCPLQFGSQGYRTDDMVYVWTHGADKSIATAPDMRLSQFDLIGWPAGNRTIFHTGGYVSMLYSDFVLRRHMGYFFINVYLPCSLLVVISWVGFWINREATADRIALGITTVLTMAFLGIDNRTDLPKVSYSTAIDYFLGMCFAFVLASIIQFSAVHFFTKHGSGEVFPDSDMEDEDTLVQNNPITEDRIRYVSKAYGNGKRSSVTFEPEAASPIKETCCSKFYQCIKGDAKYRDLKIRSSTNTMDMNSISRIDQISRCVFPAAFILFNIVYWAYYMETDQGAQFLI